MKAVLASFLFTLGSCFRTRASMQIEILALRHQLAVLQRRTNKRASLRSADRLFWVLLSRLWSQWRSALVIVKPETVIAWHRKGFQFRLLTSHSDESFPIVVSFLAALVLSDTSKFANRDSLLFATNLLWASKRPSLRSEDRLLWGVTLAAMGSGAERWSSSSRKQ